MNHKRDDESGSCRDADGGNVRSDSEPESDGQSGHASEQAGDSTTKSDR